MGSRAAKRRRYHESQHLKGASNGTEKTGVILVHGFMVYECKDCGDKWNMYLEKGVEDFGDNHKPSPFIIRCRCGGCAQDVSSIIELGDFMPLGGNMSYFANRATSNCGVPVLR